MRRTRGPLKGCGESEDRRGVVTRQYVEHRWWSSLWQRAAPRLCFLDGIQSAALAVRITIERPPTDGTLHSCTCTSQLTTGNVLNSRKIDRKCLGTARLSSGYGGSAPGTITAGNLILAPFHYYLLIIWATMVRDGRLLKARAVVCKLDLLARYGRVYARERLIIHSLINFAVLFAQARVCSAVSY